MYLGFDIGGSSIKAVLLKDREIVRSKIEDLPGNLDELFKKFKAMSGELAVGKVVEAVGLGLPGAMDQKREAMLKSPNIPYLDGQPLKKLIQAKFGETPVFINHDAFCFLLAEKTIGQAKDLKSAVLLTIGSGIGCAWMVGGEIITGANGSASEGGHMIVDIEKSLDLEEVASNKLFKNKLAITSAQAQEKLAQGDDRAREIFDLMGRNLGVGIANIINFFDPQAVIINGGIAAARETITEKMKESIDNFVVSPAARSTPIIFSELGRFGGAIGAALLAESLIKSALISSSAGVKN